jgi:hypothetical protein
MIFPWMKSSAVLEMTSLVDFQAVLPGDAVDEPGRRDRPGHPSPPALRDDQVVQENGQDVVLVDEVPGLVEDPEPVPVGVRGHAEVAFLIPDEAIELPEVLLRARRNDSAEVGVHVAVDLLDGDLVPLQDLVEILPARPEEQVHADLDAGTADDVERSCLEKSR